MAGVSLVNRQDMQHLSVILLEKAFRPGAASQSFGGGLTARVSWLRDPAAARHPCTRVELPRRNSGISMIWHAVRIGQAEDNRCRAINCLSRATVCRMSRISVAAVPVVAGQWRPAPASIVAPARARRRAVMGRRGQSRLQSCRAITYMSRPTRVELGLGIGQHVIGGEAGVEFKFEFAGKTSSGPSRQSPAARGSRSCSRSLGNRLERRRPPAAAALQRRQFAGCPPANSKMSVS